MCKWFKLHKIKKSVIIMKSISCENRSSKRMKPKSATYDARAIHVKSIVSKSISTFVIAQAKKGRKSSDTTKNCEQPSCCMGTVCGILLRLRVWPKLSSSLVISLAATDHLSLCPFFPNPGLTLSLSLRVIHSDMDLSKQAGKRMVPLAIGRPEP